MSNDTNQAQPKPPTVIDQFRSQIGNMKAEIAKALPPGIDPERFIRTVVTAVQMTPDLLYADRRSLFGSCMKAAQDGLLPDGREAVLNIYNTKQKVDGRDEWVPTVQYLPMVKGIMKVMRNSGEIAHIDAAAVYERDHFKFTRGDDPRIEHEPYDGSEDPGGVKAAYAIIKLTNGEIHREVMFRRDIEKVRDASKAKNGPGWNTWYDQFAIKAVIKRAAKLLPQSSDRVDRVLQNDNDAMGFDFNQRNTIDMETPAPQAAAPKQLQANRSSRLADIIGKTAQREPVPVEQPAEAIQQEGAQQ